MISFLGDFCENWHHEKGIETIVTIKNNILRA
jgi:hypothetical protein